MALGPMDFEENYEQIPNSSISYDSTKVTNLSVYKREDIVCGTFRIAAGKLSSGFNGINFKLPYDWLIYPVVSLISTSAADDAKVYGIIMSNSNSTGLNVRASAANTDALSVYFIGRISS